MKSFATLFSILILAACSHSQVKREPQSQTLKVDIRRADIFDMWCSNNNLTKVAPEQDARLAKKLPALTDEWNVLGPKLINELQKDLGKQFHQSEMIAAVFLCKKTPSMSLPLLINGNWYLQEKPYPNYMFASAVFHELLHTYITDNYPNLETESALIKKYSKEEVRVLAHLHLTAIQAMVYTNLGMTERLKEVVAMESDGYSQAYKRTWEIVNAEGYQKFIDELK